MRDSRIIAVAIAGVLTAAGCADDGATREALPTLCQYTFEGEVRDGPNAGFALRGGLVVIQDDDTTGHGLLVPEGEAESDTAKHVDVAVALTATTIELTFTLPDDRVMHGTGQRLGMFPGCPQTVEGDASGPAAGDSGDWVVEGAVAQAVVAGFCYLFPDYC